MQNNLYLSLLVVLLLASLSDLFIPFFVGKHYPGYSHVKHTISTLGTCNSPVQKIQSTTLIVVGILFVIFALGQQYLFSQQNWASNMYVIGIILFGVGCIFAGIFPEDIKSIPETLSGKIHGIASGMGFLFLILCPLWAIWIQDFGTSKLLNIIIFILGLLTFILFLTSENKDTGILAYTGLYQRLNLIALYSALIINFVNMKNIL